jgi:putative NADH-flavin reductase
MPATPVVAVTRQPATFPISDPRLTVGEVDVFSQQAVAGVLAGADAVLSVLGVPFTRRPVDTFSTGTANIVAAMRRNDIRRLIVVSSTATQHYHNRSNSSLLQRIFEPVISRTIGKTVYDDLRHMETIVADSGLDWTIVRPSTSTTTTSPTAPQETCHPSAASPPASTSRTTSPRSSMTHRASAPPPSSPRPTAPHRSGRT